MNPRDNFINHNTSDKESLENFGILISNIHALKDKKHGCPWHKSQTHYSLNSFLIEESYEFISATNSNQKGQMMEELGDILLQILLHSEISKSKGDFELKDVISALNKKIVNRHPYVFKEKVKVSLKKAKEIWKEIKKSEKQKENKVNNTKVQKILDDLPPYLQTEKISIKVNKLGFNWDNETQIFKKINEEIVELKEAIKSNNNANIREEFGDILFTLLNLSFFLKIDHNKSLKEANEKFIKRLSILEKYNIEEKSYKNFQRLWKLSKRQLKENS